MTDRTTVMMMMMIIIIINMKIICARAGVLDFIEHKPSQTPYPIIRRSEGECLASGSRQSY